MPIIPAQPTLAQRNRAAVDSLSEIYPADVIAQRLGLSVERVEQLIDELEPTHELPIGRQPTARNVTQDGRLSDGGYVGRKVRNVEHGTPQGYRRHYKRHETPCNPCRLAYNAYASEVNRAARARAKETKGAFQ